MLKSPSNLHLFRNSQKHRTRICRKIVSIVFVETRVVEVGVDDEGGHAGSSVVVGDGDTVDVGFLDTYLLLLLLFLFVIFFFFLFFYFFFFF